MGAFFVSWALWEQMTFVLAVAICGVFLIGLFKLWRTSRQMRRQEVIDEEKRARIGEMQRMGMPPDAIAASSRKHRGHVDIPFGVRAIQTGVEVDGIWISRPNTPSRSSTRSKAAPTPLASCLVETTDSSDTETTTDRPDRPVASGSGSGSSSTPPSSTQAPNTTVGGRHLPQRDVQNGPSSAAGHYAPAPSPTPEPTPATRLAASKGTRGSGPLNEEALRRLEGSYAPVSAPPSTVLPTVLPTGHVGSPLRQSMLNTYMPTSTAQLASSGTSAAKDAHQHTRYSRLSTASADSVTLQSAPTAPTQKYGSGATKSKGHTSSGSQSSTESPDHRQPLLASLASSHGRPSDANVNEVSVGVAGVADWAQAQPGAADDGPSVFPGGAKANRSVRKVNSSFQVLPAGTFAAYTGRSTSGPTLAVAGTGTGTGSRQPASSNGSNADDEADAQHAAGIKPAPTRNKLRRSSAR